MHKQSSGSYITCPVLGAAIGDTLIDAIGYAELLETVVQDRWDLAFIQNRNLEMARLNCILWQLNDVRKGLEAEAARLYR